MLPSPPPLQEWSEIRDPQTRLSRLIQWAKQQPPLPDSLRQDRYLVPGCLARLWWIPSWNNGQCHFSADSDSALVKGLALVIAARFSGKSPEDILHQNIDPLVEAKLDHHLTANRRDGLGKIQSSIREFAESHR